MLTQQRDPAFSSRCNRLFFSGDPTEPLPCGGGRRLEPLHAAPNMYFVRHFLTAAELDHLDRLITQRRAGFKPSHTDGADGMRNLDGERTSFSLALPKASDTALRAIEARAAELVGLPPDHVEPLQVVSYRDGARFDMHHDVAAIRVDDDRDEVGASGEECGTSGGGGASGGHYTSLEGVTVETPTGPRRLVTLFVYLNTLPEGIGHTEFPLLRLRDEDGGGVLSVRPRCGAALVFCNLDEAGLPDVRLVHRACPVPPGHIKFGMNIWVSDVSQQAHALATAASGAKRQPAPAGGGLLAPLLYTELADTPPPPPAALIGLRFAKRFPPPAAGDGRRDGEAGAAEVFVGRVAEYHPVTLYRLEYDDGDEEDVGVDELLALPLAEPSQAISRRVGKHFPGHGRHDGSVIGFDPDPNQGYTVRYDDGDEECIYEGELLRILLPPKAEAPDKGKRRRAGH